VTMKIGPGNILLNNRNEPVLVLEISGNDEVVVLDRFPHGLGYVKGTASLMSSKSPPYNDYVYTSRSEWQAVNDSPKLESERRTLDAARTALVTLRRESDAAYRSAYETAKARCIAAGEICTKCEGKGYVYEDTYFRSSDEWHLSHTNCRACQGTGLSTRVPVNHDDYDVIHCTFDDNGAITEVVYRSKPGEVVQIA